MITDQVYVLEFDSYKRRTNANKKKRKNRPPCFGPNANGYDFKVSVSIVLKKKKNREI